MRAPAATFVEDVVAAVSAAASATAASSGVGLVGVPDRPEGVVEDRLISGSNTDASDATDLSSVHSMSRQITELTEVRSNQVMSGQFLSFQGRSTDYWVRQNTVPVRRQNQACVDGIRRQISAPDHALVESTPFIPLEQIRDGPEELTPPSSRQLTTQAENTLDAGIIETAICTAVSTLEASVAISDPRSFDSDLIAVSDGFLQMTGYQRLDIIGENCRFLNEGCPIDADIRQRLKRSVETGEPFRAVLTNRGKSGNLFFNLIDLRGLVLARNARTDESLWVSIAIQMDVTHMDRDSLPNNHSAVSEQVAGRIRRRLMKYLGELGLGAAMTNFKYLPKEGTEFSESVFADEQSAWYLLQETCWTHKDEASGVLRPCEQVLPDLQDLALTIPPLIGLSGRVRADTGWPTPHGDQYKDTEPLCFESEASKEEAPAAAEDPVDCEQEPLAVLPEAADAPAEIRHEREGGRLGLLLGQHAPFVAWLAIAVVAAAALRLRLARAQRI